MKHRLTLCLPALLWIIAAYPSSAAEPPRPADQPAQKWIKLDVPFVPTPRMTLDTMLDLAAIGPNDIVYDLGSGDGRIAIAAVQERGAKRAVGIDINPVRVEEATANAKAAGVSDRVSFIEGDVFKADFSAATVVTMYLLDYVNLKLRPRILDELKPGTRVVSHQFSMQQWEPDSKVVLQGVVPVYFWIVPAKVGGAWSGKLEDKSVALQLQQNFQFFTGSSVADGALGEVKDGKLKGDMMTFTMVLASGRTFTFDGKVTDQTLTGTFVVDGVATKTTLQRTAK
jgi:SAM-dependent methyltransferase